MAAGGRGASRGVVRRLYERLKPNPKNLRNGIKHQVYYQGKCAEADALRKLAKAYGIKNEAQLRNFMTKNKCKSEAFTMDGGPKSPCACCEPVLIFLNAF